MLYMLLGAFASLVGGMKVIKKRRELQMIKPYKVSLLEALIHTVFDTADKLSLEWVNVNRIVDQRKQESQYKMLQYGKQQQPLMLTYQPTSQPQTVQYLPSTPSIVDVEDETVRLSIPDNRTK